MAFRLLSRAPRFQTPPGETRLPDQLCHLIACVDGEDIGLVLTVRRIRVVGADPDHLLIGQIVDVHRLTCHGIGPAVQFNHGLNQRMRLRQLAE